MASFFSTSQFITDFFNVLIILGGGLFLYFGKMQIVDITTFIVSISLFISPINQVINFTEQFQNGSTGFQRFIEIMDEKEEEQNKNAEILDNVRGDIEFKNVSFSYNEGETIALIGPTGGGKTTICHLIPRFYNLNSGDILIDGKSISKFSLESLRKHIGIVQQDVFLFNGTIKENILYGKLDASDEEVIDAARRANILDFINSLPNGFETNIGERGVKLSGGQKQRLSIARAFLKNPEILILDEATSALDNTTELLIQNSLNELSKGRTTLVVAHRLSTIKNANEIMVVSNGKIVERGDHEHLMSEDGIYKSLYMLQFKNVSENELNSLNNFITMLR